MPAVSKLRIGLFYVLMALQAVGDPGGAGTPSSKCSNALHACISLTQAQDSEILQLKQDNSQLAKALVEANKAPLLPTWAWVTLGVLAGAVVGAKVLK